ncbi:hypothetical protein CPB84DRAFT_1789851 [Gymnopilus junonius]|uniref:Uncharacterized protein n=1 Tax=Gymnopilus junonius TaxID=109634 RepID=A0A9P5TJT1_GYMJU|nr:hypothetical protein CPB84DRAFT_1789851 [Gymnopilus junonius]
MNPVLTSELWHLYFFFRSNVLHDTMHFLLHFEAFCRLQNVGLLLPSNTSTQSLSTIAPRPYIATLGVSYCTDSFNLNAGYKVCLDAWPIHCYSLNCSTMDAPYSPTLRPDSYGSTRFLLPDLSPFACPNYYLLRFNVLFFPGTLSAFYHLLGIC